MPFFHNFFIGNTLSKILNKGECLKFEIFYILAWSKILNIGECLKFEVFYFSAWLKFSLEMVIIKKWRIGNSCVDTCICMLLQPTVRLMSSFHFTIMIITDWWRMFWLKINKSIFVIYKALLHDITCWLWCSALAALFYTDHRPVINGWIKDQCIWEKMVIFWKRP